MKTKKRFFFFLLMAFVTLQITGCASKTQVTVDHTDYEVKIRATEDCVMDLEIILNSERVILQTQIKVSGEHARTFEVSEFVREESLKNEPEKYKIVSAHVSNIKRYSQEDAMAIGFITFGTPILIVTFIISIVVHCKNKNQTEEC